MPNAMRRGEQVGTAGGTAAAAWIERADRPLLLLAGVAIALYLAELHGWWQQLGIEPAMIAITTVVDAVFVVDLCAKVVVLRRPYIRSPWFLIDLLAALPLLAVLHLLPEVAGSLMAVRGLRMFRILRTLRVLRLLGALRGLHPHRTTEMMARQRVPFERALTFAVIGYTVSFLAIMVWIEHTSAQPHLTEFYAVLGSVLGMVLVLSVMTSAEHQVHELVNFALPKQVAAHFLRNPDAYHETYHAPATVLFCDIQGFTRAVERLGDDLDAVKKHLEGVVDAMVDLHVQHDLIVDKFIGDAVMSFRGGRLVNGEPGEHAYRCVRAAIDTVRRIQTLADPHFRAVKVGGASMDDGLIGTFGTSRRLSYTILGDRVNLAARLESSCNALGVSTLFCHATYELTRDRKDIAWRKLGHLRVKGKVAPEPVYEAMDAGDGGEWLRGFNAGMDAFLRRDFGAAHHAFVSVQTLRPGGDVPSQVYAQRSETLLSKPTPSDIDLTLPFDPPPVASA